MESKFLGEKGLTKTSAQHIKDIAGHLIERVQEQVNNIGFVNETINIIGSEKKQTTSKGWTIEALNKLQEQLEYISKVKSLQAWLGEAIKDKSAIESVARAYDFDDYILENKIELPERPIRPSQKTESDWLETLSVKERNRYLHLQTLCAVYGKMIHPQGAFDKARKRQQSIESKPVCYYGDGSNTIFHNFSSSVPIEEVDAKYFELQAKHREYQAEFNALKHKCDLWIEEQYEKEFADYEIKNKLFSDAKSVYFDKALKYKEELGKKVRDLKIIIPHDLEEIYQEVSKLGK